MVYEEFPEWKQLKKEKKYKEAAKQYKYISKQLKINIDKTF